MSTTNADHETTGPRPTGVAGVRPHSVISGDGTEHEVDVLIAATGFDVVRFLSSVEVIGAG